MRPCIIVLKPPPPFLEFKTLKARTNFWRLAALGMDVSDVESRVALSCHTLSGCPTLGEFGDFPPKAQLLPFGLVRRALALVPKPTYVPGRPAVEAFLLPGPHFHHLQCPIQFEHYIKI